MKQRWMLALALALVLGSVIVPGAVFAQERLDAPPVDGFVVGFEAKNDNQAIREEVPRGETVEDWSQMVTTQRFAGPPGISPLEFAVDFAERLMAACPEADVIEPHSLEQDGRDAATVGFICPNSPATGGYEQMTAIVLQGDEALHMRQMAWRKPPSEAQLAQAMADLRAVRVCSEVCEKGR